MSVECEAAFKGTHVMAISAMHSVQQQLLALGEDDNKDSDKHRVKLALSILRSICSAAAKPEGKHNRVYCDTLVLVLSKYIKPSIGAKYWSMYLEHVRYLHHLIADKKLFAEAKIICDLVASFPSYLQSEGDYKVVLGMYLQHLLGQHHHTRVNAHLAQEHIACILDALKELFMQMLHCNKKDNFTYPELITDFVQYLVPKRVSTVFNFLASLPANKTQMYDAFFALLKGIRTSEPTKEDVQAHSQRHIEALAVFFQLDVSDRLQQQLALRHLRTCRDMFVFANDKSANYVFSLLYYLVKLVYGLPNPGEFKEIYKDLSGKLITFFDRYGEGLMQERWFTDVPVVIAVLFTHLQQHPSTPFGSFWQHMNSIECYIAHFELILGCIRLAPRIVETKLIKLDCCTSARKHTMISLVVSALAAYSSYAIAVDDTSGVSEELFISLRTQLLLVMRHGVSVLDSLACITSESAELKLIYARIIQLTLDMRTPLQIRLCITLVEFLVRIRHKFAIKDWTLLLRRLYKMTLRAGDASLTADLHAAHIASKIQEYTWPDISHLRNSIGNFYTNSPHITSGQCVLQLNLQSHSPLKVFLDTPQKHLLHWLETQEFLKYHKSNEQLQLTLMDCSPTLYGETLVARGSGDIQPAVATRLRKMKKQIEQKLEKTAGLSRLEYLCAAHINTALIFDSLKLQKDILAVEIKCQEDNLEELLQRKEFAMITVANEVKLIKQVEAALECFRKFYEKADTEAIVNNEVHIDWEAIITDVTSLSLYLQLSGYLDLATEAWILHYRIANTIDDEYNSLRSLTYFCEHSEYFLTSEKGINLAEEVARKEKFLLHATQQLPTLTNSLQNYVLICLCQVAHYYARNGQLSYAQILLELVQQVHAELPNKQGKYNVVLGTVDMVKFRILWKHLDNDQHQIDSQLSQRCMLREMEGILERFRGDFFKLSRSELMSYTILLLSVITQVAECAANRLCDNLVNSYFAGIFKILLQSGSALRLIQILAMWAWINLQMEYLKKAQIKVKLIEYILGVKSLEYLRQMSEEAAAEKKLAVPTSNTAWDLMHSGMEPLRKMIPLNATPIKTMKMLLSPSTRGESSLKRFLCVQGNDTLQQYQILQWCCFMVGCLNARLYFLADNHDNLEDFYEASQQWLEDHKQNTILQISFQNIQLLSLQHYVNYLRLHKKYEKALSCIKSALVSCTDMRGNVDTVYQINLLLQLRATKREMSVKPESRNCAGWRRALAFDVSPDLDEPEGEGLLTFTTVNVVPASARKKVTTLGFEIFNGSESTPKHTSTQVAVGAQGASETIEKLVHNKIAMQPLAALSSVRKMRKQLAAEAELQTPAKASAVNTKTNSKSLTARKLRAIRAAASEASSNTSNSTPETDTDDILNQCQRIESVDLLDSDDAKSQRNDVTNTVVNTHAKKQSARKASKHRENIFDICKKIETIDLLEHEEHTLVTSKSHTPTLNPQKHKPNTPEIIDISDDADDFKTPESTFYTLTAPPKTANAKKTTKKSPHTTQTSRKNKEANTNKASTEMSTCATSETATIIPNELHVQVVEKIREETKTTTTKLNTRTKTEVRTLKVITKDTEIRISPAPKTAPKSKENTTTKGSTTRGRPRTTRKTPNKQSDENVAPPVTVSRTLSRRARQ
ncbi:protein three rows [Anastrepha obliqua]|uniref:protein three rows n=1 Tax=Anastrepha obliqua TaxID=95512 RepID=UPI00240A62BF|nr:protein three rows [Anastrepha obliqua]